jgi:hypothetical protein
VPGGPHRSIRDLRPRAPVTTLKNYRVERTLATIRKISLISVGCRRRKSAKLRKSARTHPFFQRAARATRLRVARRIDDRCVRHRNDGACERPRLRRNRFHDRRFLRCVRRDGQRDRRCERRRNGRLRGGGRRERWHRGLAADGWCRRSERRSWRHRGHGRRVVGGRRSVPGGHDGVRRSMQKLLDRRDELRRLRRALPSRPELR